MAETRVNWLAGLATAIVMTVAFGLLWNDWAFAAAIGVMLAIVAAFAFTPKNDTKRQ